MQLLNFDGRRVKFQDNRIGSVLETQCYINNTYYGTVDMNNPLLLSRVTHISPTAKQKLMNKLKMF
jgi:hypothetical protein